MEVKNAGGTYQNGIYKYGVYFARAHWRKWDKLSRELDFWWIYYSVFTPYDFPPQLSFWHMKLYVDDTILVHDSLANVAKRPLYQKSGYEFVSMLLWVNHIHRGKLLSITGTRSNIFVNDCNLLIEILRSLMVN